MSFFELLKGLVDYGLSGLVAAISMTFAMYQTKRIEKLTDTVINESASALHIAKQLFQLNTNGSNINDKEEKKP